jgi:hypothetical protein
VQSDDLRTCQVVTPFEALGKMDRKETIVVDDLIRAPSVCVAVVAMIEDLEPSVTSSLISDSRVNFL